MRFTIFAVALLGTNASVEAFAPKKFTSPSSRLHLSLSDQLSQLSYDSSFIGKASSAIKGSSSVASSAASIPIPVEKVATDSSVAFQVPDFSDILKNSKIDLSSNIDLSSITIPEISIDSLPNAPLESLEAAIAPIWASLQEAVPALATIDAPPALVIILTSIITYSLIGQLLTLGASPPPSSPYPMNKYDPVSARRYFDARPLEILARAVQVTLLSGTFLSGLLVDFVGGNLDENADKRAQELSVLLTKLGPSFIKVSAQDVLYILPLDVLQYQLIHCTTTQ
jgi:hypothetical protein